MTLRVRQCGIIHPTANVPCQESFGHALSPTHVSEDHSFGLAWDNVEVREPRDVRDREMDRLHVELDQQRAEIAALRAAAALVTERCDCISGDDEMQALAALVKQ